MSTTNLKRIVSDPGICGGKPCIAGTRIRVQDVFVWYELRGQSADEIVSHFPQLTMADVYGALEYFWDHQAEVRRQMHEEADFIEQMKQKYPSRLKPKRAGTDGTDHSLPS